MNPIRIDHDRNVRPPSAITIGDDFEDVCVGLPPTRNARVVRGIVIESVHDASVHLVPNEERHVSVLPNQPVQRLQVRRHFHVPSNDRVERPGMAPTARRRARNLLRGRRGHNDHRPAPTRCYTSPLTFALTSESLSCAPTQTTTFEARAPPIASSFRMRSSIGASPPSVISSGCITTLGGTEKKPAFETSFTAPRSRFSNATKSPTSNLDVVNGGLASNVASLFDSRCLTRRWFFFTRT